MGRPQYLDMPMGAPPPRPTGANGAVPPLPAPPVAPATVSAPRTSPVAEFVNDVLTGKFTDPAPPRDVKAPQGPVTTGARSAIPQFKMVDDPLLDAIDKVYRAAAAQIAFHENKAKQLRQALAPFAAFREGATAPNLDNTAEGFIKNLLDAAGKLEAPQ